MKNFNLNNNEYKRPYLIADIAANHDGSFSRVKKLIKLAKASGADAVKFQHFTADTIVSDDGFKLIGESLVSHQSKWKKSVFEVYKEASLSQSWTPRIKEECDKVGIDFFTSPYSHSLVDHVDPYVSMYKIGSGDIDWIDLLLYIAKKNKPMIVASGASDIYDVYKSISEIIKFNNNICLMQCNTNYTASSENMKYINLNVLKTYKILFPNLTLGLSDHTFGHTTVLGAIALGASVIEKHFTDDNSREGPDHKFSMNPETWYSMYIAANDLFDALGDGYKKVENNEIETRQLQRRAMWFNCDVKLGEKITSKMFNILRPCPQDAAPLINQFQYIGKKLKVDKNKGDYLKLNDF